MPVTFLNNTIALFIVGGTPIAWLIFRQHIWLTTLASQAGTDETSGSILFALALIPLAALLGAITAGAADFLRYGILKKAARNFNLACFFFREREYDDLKRHVIAVEKLMPAQEDGGSFADSLDYAAGYFLANAKRVQIDWLNAHYSGYTLASSLCCLIVPFGMLDFWLHGDIIFGTYNLCAGASEFGALVLMSYMAAIYAVDMYLYSYHMACRFVVIHHESERRKPQRPNDGIQTS